MTGEKEIVRDLKREGFITAQEACKIVGRVCNGHALDYFRAFGVRSVSIERGTKGQKRHMFLKTDVKRLAK